MRNYEPKEEIVSTRSWTITITNYSDGSATIKRENNGFTAIELLGLASLAQQEILAQIKGQITVKSGVEREIIKNS